MSIETIQDFFLMGGHAYYIWSAYLFVFIVIAVEIFFLAKRRQRIVNRLMSEARAEKSTLEIGES